MGIAFYGWNSHGLLRHLRHLWLLHTRFSNAVISVVDQHGALWNVKMIRDFRAQYYDKEQDSCQSPE
jgi:hypothetical protein